VRVVHLIAAHSGYGVAAAGCHYARGCGKYTECCGACPQLGSRQEAELSRHIWQCKRTALQHVAPDRLYLVTPRAWLAKGP
jgi:hypothetical protein